MSNIVHTALAFLGAWLVVGFALGVLIGRMLRDRDGTDVWRAPSPWDAE